MTMVTSPERTCANCGAPMQELQDWCLQCGAGQPGSLAGGRGWRAGAAILAVAALLVVGASVAAYAALTKPSTKPRKALASRPVGGVAPAVPGATAPAVPGGTAATPTPGGTSAPGVPTTVKSTPPKIPLQTPTPKGSEPPDSALFPPETGKATKNGSSGSGKPSGSGLGLGSGSGQGQGQGQGQGGNETGSEAPEGGEPPSPILLDTNAAQTYDPYAYPSTMFGDPSLAIDGETSTAWTAAVDPAKAPNMAEGLVLDLRTAEKLARATVRTSTIGTTVEMYGANGHALPPSITDPAWKRLSGAKVLKKKSSTLKLKTAGLGYRFVVLWLVRAPAGASAVAIRELELFAAK
jgi:hypothetical protein